MPAKCGSSAAAERGNATVHDGVGAGEAELEAARDLLVPLRGGAARPRARPRSALRDRSCRGCGPRAPPGEEPGWSPAASASVVRAHDGGTDAAATSTARPWLSPGLLSRRVTSSDKSTLKLSEIFTVRSKALGPVTAAAVGTLALYCKLSFVLDTQSADRWFVVTICNMNTRIRKAPKTQGFRRNRRTFFMAPRLLWCYFGALANVFCSLLVLSSIKV